MKLTKIIISLLLVSKIFMHPSAAYAQGLDEAAESTKWIPSFASKNTFAFLAEGDTSRALIFSRKCIQVNPENYSAWFAFGVTKATIAEYNKSNKPLYATLIDSAIYALKESTRLNTDYPSINASAFNIMAACKRTIGDYGGAVEDLTESLAIQPLSSAYLERGTIKYLQEDYEGAIYDFTKFETLYGTGKMSATDKKVVSEIANMYYLRGKSKAEIGDYKSASDDYNTAIKFDKDDANIYKYSGYAKFSLKEFENAILDLNKSLDIDNQDHQTWIFRGKAKGESGDIKGAISDYSEAIRLAPNCATAWNNRGWRKQQIGLENEARLDFKKARELGPKDSLLYINNYNYLKNRLKIKNSSINLITVAINNYQLFEELGPIEIAIKNSYGLQNTFLRRNFLKSSTQLHDDNATRTNIIGELSKITNKNDILDSDIMVFYFSGYGRVDKDKVSVCAYDYSNKPSDMITEEYILSIFNKYPAKFKLFIFDLYPIENGKTFSEFLDEKEVAQNINRPTLDIDAETLIQWTDERKNSASGSACIISMNKAAMPGSSALLSKTIIKGLNEGFADSDKDKAISIGELTDFIKQSFAKSQNIAVPIIKTNLRPNFNIFIYSN